MNPDLQYFPESCRSATGKVESFGTLVKTIFLSLIPNLLDHQTLPQNASWETLELDLGSALQRSAQARRKQKLEACPDKIHQNLQAAPNPEKLLVALGAQESRISVLWRPPSWPIQGFDSIWSSAILLRRVEKGLVFHVTQLERLGPKRPENSPRAT